MSSRPPRPDFEWDRLVEGMPIPFDEMQRVDEAVSRPVDESGGWAGDGVAQAGMGDMLTPNQSLSKWVKIVDSYDDGTGTILYRFAEVNYNDDNDEDLEEGAFGSALEVNDNPSVPADTIVQVWPSEDDLAGAEGEMWRFSYPPAGTGGGGPIDIPFDVGLVGVDLALSGTPTGWNVFQVELPGPGEYLVLVTVRWWVQTIGGAGGERITVELRDDTNGVSVGPAVQILARVFTAQERGIETTQFQFNYTPAGGTYPAVVRLYGSHDGFTGGSNTTWLTYGFGTEMIAIELQDLGGGGGGGTAGVSSLNTLTGAVTLAAGTNITITPSGSTLTIDATGGSGGGITTEDAQDATAALFAAGTHSGITFAYNDPSNSMSATVTGAPWSGITGHPTTLAGYGITDGATIAFVVAGYQPLDADLTTLATATPGNSYYYGTDLAGAKGFYPLPPVVREKIFRYSNTLTMADPGPGYVRANGVPGPVVTVIAFDRLDFSGTDVSNLLESLIAGDGLFIQDQDDSTDWLRFRITGPAVNHVGYFTVPVAFIDGVTGGAANNTHLLCAFSTSGGGGGGTTVADTDTLDLTITGGLQISGVVRTQMSLTSDTSGLKLAGDSATPGNSMLYGTSSAGAKGWYAQPASGTYQPLDADLTAIAAISATGSWYYRSAANVWTAVTVGASLTFAGGVLGAIQLQAAGLSHQSGYVPDPGATAHPTQPRLLADNATWVKQLGRVLGYSYVATQESIAGDSAWHGLTTAQAITLTLDETTDVLVLCFASYANTGAAANGVIGVQISGTDNVVGQNTPHATGVTVGVSGLYKTTLTAGTYTFTMRFLAGGGTAFFQFRSMTLLTGA